MTTQGPARIGSLRRLWRYYQAGVVNTLFGYGLYALFVKLGLGIYLAQFIAHFCGVAFNYVTYSRHAFPDYAPSKLRFFASYIGNYLLGLASLALSARLVHSPYVAGLIAVLFVSIINYFVLRKFVFLKPSSPDEAGAQHADT